MSKFDCSVCGAPLNTRHLERSIDTLSKVLSGWVERVEGLEDKVSELAATLDGIEQAPRAAQKQGDASASGAAAEESAASKMLGTLGPFSRAQAEWVASIMGECDAMKIERSTLMRERDAERDAARADLAEAYDKLDVALRELDDVRRMAQQAFKERDETQRALGDAHEVIKRALDERDEARAELASLRAENDDLHNEALGICEALGIDTTGDYDVAHEVFQLRARYDWLRAALLAMGERAAGEIRDAKARKAFLEDWQKTVGGE